MEKNDRKELPGADSGKSIGWQINPKPENWYDIARICINGHIISTQVKSSPHIKQRFCDKCGAATITKCQHCHLIIKGTYHSGSSISSWAKPSFCPNCGKPYPWTELALKAARELTDTLKNLTTKEREALKKSLNDIVRDTPQTPVAANRFKKIMAKAGQVTAGAVRDIVVDIASEAAKKIIWPS
jgi:hypothetical protein